MAQRGRPRGSTNKPKDGAPKAQKGQVRRDLTGHNSGIPPEGVIVHHKLRKMRDDARRAELRAELKKLDKDHERDAKNDGVDLKLIAALEKVEKLTLGDQVQEHNKKVAYAKALRVQSAAYMGDLIDLANAGTSEAAIMARAHEAGIKDGMMAVDRDRDTYDITTPVGQEYERGYQIGQIKNRKALLKMSAPDDATDDDQDGADETEGQGADEAVHEDEVPDDEAGLAEEEPGFGAEAEQPATLRRAPPKRRGAPPPVMN